MTEPNHHKKHAILFASIVFYLVLLVCSHIWQGGMTAARSGTITKQDLPRITLPATDAQGRVDPDRTLELFYGDWGDGPGDSPRLPVVLLHGSPGQGGNFALLGPELARDGRRVYAPDLPGSGDTAMAPDMSHRANARLMLSFLDRLGIDRAHVVGWSSGGGVALEMGHLAPERIASVTMLASIGAQETEGSGSYFFEHLKYGVGLATWGVLPELVPHFGLLGTYSQRSGWLWAFWDADQRRQSAIMGTLEVPVLILHGAHDPLVTARSAQRHHEMIPTSRLVMLDASHFMPFAQVEETRAYLLPFFARHDTPGVTPETDFIDLAPITPRHGVDGLLRQGAELMGRYLPWWAGLIVFTIIVRFRPTSGIVGLMLFVVLMGVDFGVALLAMLLGRAWWLMRGADQLDRPWTVLGWVRALLFILPAFVLGAVGGVLTLGLSEGVGFAGLLAGLLLTNLALMLARLGVTREGWQRMRGGLRRLTNHEYYPSGILYLLTLWAAFMRIGAGKGLRTLTAVNPGYSDDGGIREERKSELDARFPDDPAILRCRLIEPDANPGRRAEHAAHLLGTGDALGGYPVIAKPDRGARGTGVRVLSSNDDLHRYCRDHPEPFVLQRFHPGPVEVGILWARAPQTVAQAGGPAGFIYGLNTKEFPEVVGDARRSLRQLILAHPRHRAQARMFLDRLREQQHLIPGDAERVAIGGIGNHAQGALFRDAPRLITPELSARINAIADGFRDEHGRGFDIGRFDVRCTSYEALMRGEGMGIVELNGLTSEPTNLYDPDRSLRWAQRTMLGYWRHVETLSDARIAHGSGEPISKKQAWDLLNEFLRAMSR